MKVALVHDYIKEYGGAERVLEALHEIWPEAPVYTSVYIPKYLGPHKERFKNWDIKTSWLQQVPFKEKLISPLRILAPIIFRNFDFSKFDVVIVSATGAYSPNGLKIKNQSPIQSGTKVKSTTQKWKMGNGKWEMGIKTPLQICYCHTPPRYLYGYATAREWKKNLIFRTIGEIGSHFLRLVDFRSVQNVDYFIANSKNVADRIKKFYRKDSIVIYPPVEITNSKSQALNKSQSSKFKGEYFLAGGRIARPKHIDLIIKTFEELNSPLKVFGREFGSNVLGRNLKLLNHNQNIEFVGEVSDSEKLELMRNAKAYIFASEDEDFGITPVEAMSVGTPVIAYKSGGVLETVVQNPTAGSRYSTGLFFDELSVESLCRAVKKFEKTKFDGKLITKHAQKFNKERFKKEIKEFVYRNLASRKT